MNMKNTAEKKAGELGSDDGFVQNTIERGAEAYGQAEQAVTDGYSKVVETAGEVAKAAHETYEKAKSFSRENPGKAILISLGIGAGLGLLLGASCRSSRASRKTRPVVNGASDIAQELLR